MSVSQTSSIAHLQTDPLRNFKFLVDITANPQGYSLYGQTGGTVSIGFMSVSGLNVNVSVIAYREGGMNTTTQKMPGQADFSPIVLTRGVVVGHPEDIDWLKQLFQVIQGSNGSVAGRDFRQTIDVRVLAHPITSASAPVSAWFRVYNAWPTAVAYSDLDAGTNQLLISQMTLAHEGWDYELASSWTGDAAIPGTGSGQTAIAGINTTNAP